MKESKPTTTIDFIELTEIEIISNCAFHNPLVGWKGRLILKCIRSLVFYAHSKGLTKESIMIPLAAMVHHEWSSHLDYMEMMNKVEEEMRTANERRKGDKYERSR